MFTLHSLIGTAAGLGYSRLHIFISNSRLRFYFVAFNHNAIKFANFVKAAKYLAFLFLLS